MKVHVILDLKKKKKFELPNKTYTNWITIANELFCFQDFESNLLKNNHKINVANFLECLNHFAPVHSYNPLHTEEETRMLIIDDWISNVNDDGNAYQKQEVHERDFQIESRLSIYIYSLSSTYIQSMSFKNICQTFLRAGATDL